MHPVGARNEATRGAHGLAVIENDAVLTGARRRSAISQIHITHAFHRRFVRCARILESNVILPIWLHTHCVRRWVCHTTACVCELLLAIRNSGTAKTQQTY